MRALMFCAVNQDRTVRTSEVAEKCNASENHLGQVINTLSHEGYVNTLRGRGGGLRLAQTPEQISVGEVMRLLEAATPFTECFHADGNTCPIVSVCKLKPALSRALEAFYTELDRVTLEDLVAGNTGLEQLFGNPAT
ncbi:MAG: Rrf2 family nitric oxide-sensitive transcriptional repressor [Dinoroseobacter sp.]|jgi:Rrf2 family nitric oxide-sensitive transcriptional repressor